MYSFQLAEKALLTLQFLSLTEYFSVSCIEFLDEEDIQAPSLNRFVDTDPYNDFSPNIKEDNLYDVNSDYEPEILSDYFPEPCLDERNCQLSHYYFDFENHVWNVQLYIYTTSKNPPFVVDLKSYEESLPSLVLKEDRPVVFIIHGFKYYFYDSDSKWTGAMKNAFLSKDCNVVGVDWGKEARQFYTVTQKVVPKIAKKIAEFIIKLTKEKQVKYNQIHLVGHSMGAHMAGDIGQELIDRKARKVGKITALDTAGILYFFNVSLARTPAEYQEIIHTDILLFGTPMSDGHYDFFPNGGFFQSGCPFSYDQYFSDYPLDIMDNHYYSLKKLYCSHDMAPKIYCQVLSQEKPFCQYLAYACPNNDAFEAGECISCGEDNENCALLAYDGGDDEVTNNMLAKQRSRAQLSNLRNLKYLLKVDKDGSCLYHFHVRIYFFTSLVLLRDIVTPFFTLDGGQSGIKFIKYQTSKLTQRPFNEPFEKFYSLDFVVTSTTFNKSFDGMTIKRDEFYFGSVRIEKIRLTYMSHVNPDIRKQFTIELCLRGLKGLYGFFKRRLIKC